MSGFCSVRNNLVCVCACMLATGQELDVRAHACVFYKTRKCVCERMIGRDLGAPPLPCVPGRQRWRDSLWLYERERQRSPFVSLTNG